MAGEVNEGVTRKIAQLSRLQLTDGEIAQYTKELSKIVDYIASLSTVNVEGVEPVIHGIPLDAHFRDDTPISLPEEQTRKIVACSESPLYDQFRVPQVLGGE